MPWEAVAAVAGLLSAIAAAVSATNSWRAASASQQTSRNAMEALAVGLRPKVQARVSPVVYGTNPQGTQVAHRLEAWVKNFSDHEAVDIEVEARGLDGTALTAHAAQVRPSSFRTWKNRDETNDLRPTLAEGDAQPNIERLVVRFWDAKKLAQYEREERYRVERRGPDAHGITGESRWTEVSEDRIKGP